MTNETQHTSPDAGRDKPSVVPKLTEDERSETEGTAGSTNGLAQRKTRIQRPNLEVPAIARPQRFTADCKLRTVREAEECAQPGEIGALLRREGLNSSILIEPEQGASSIIREP